MFIFKCNFFKDNDKEYNDRQLHKLSIISTIRIVVTYVNTGYTLNLNRKTLEICKMQVNFRFILQLVNQVLTLFLPYAILTLTDKKERYTMKVAYIRVSTAEQNEDRQLEAMKQYNIDKFFTEKVSGKDINRPQLKAMLDFVREGDTVYIHDFSRLARSTKDLLDIVEQLNKKNVHLHSNKENLDTSTPTGKLMLTMIGAINEFERTNLLERQREGIAVAKKNGKYKGGQVKKIDKDTFNSLYEQYRTRQINKTEFAKQLNVSRPTLNKLINEHTAE